MSDQESEAKDIAEAKDAIKKNIMSGLSTQLKVLNVLANIGKEPTAETENFEEKLSENPVINTFIDFISAFAVASGGSEAVGEMTKKVEKERKEREENGEATLKLLNSISEPLKGMMEIFKGEAPMSELGKTFDECTSKILEEVSKKEPSSTETVSSGEELSSTETVSSAE